MKKSIQQIKKKSEVVPNPDDEVSYYLNARGDEYKWRKDQVHYSDKELLAIFPTAKSDLSAILKEWTDKQASLEQQAKQKIRKTKSTPDEFLAWLQEWSLKRHELQELVGINRQTFRLRNLINISRGKKTKTRGVTQEEIDQAKNIPILSVVESLLGQPKRVGRYYKALCPLHNETNPSFFIYPTTNTFVCYGCQTKGDLINFIQLFYELDFVQAVRWLLEY